MQSTTSLRVQPEPLAERPRDACVGLVIDEQVDLGQRQSGAGDRLERHVAHPRDRVAKDLRPVHPDQPLGSG